MTRKIIVLTALFLKSYFFCHSQVKIHDMAAFDYSFGIASGGLNSYISDKIFNGLHFHWRYFLKRDVSIGLSTGWNSFSTTLPRAVYETDRGTVSAVQTRYFHSFPFVATAYYYLRHNQHIMPYFGGAAGPYFLKYEKFFGVVPVDKKNIRFGIRPEAGVVIPFKESTLGMIITGRFNKVFYSHEEVNNLHYFEIAIGLYAAYPVFDRSLLY